MTDFQIADEVARFRFIHANRGLTTGWGATSRLVHSVGGARTAQILTSAKTVSIHHTVSVLVLGEFFAASKPRVKFIN